MSVDSIKCPKCRQPLPDGLINAGIQACTFCGKHVGITVFPALFRKHAIHNPDDHRAEEGASSCFYHENLNATVHCDGCGRFLCELCRVDMNGRNICPNCIMSNRENDSLGDLEKRRPLHCRTAMFAAFVGFLVPMFFVGQIIAVIFSIKSFMQKPPMYDGGSSEKATSTLALLLAITGALLGLMFWGKMVFD